MDNEETLSALLADFGGGPPGNLTDILPNSVPVDERFRRVKSLPLYSIQFHGLSYAPGHTFHMGEDDVYLMFITPPGCELHSRTADVELSDPNRYLPIIDAALLRCGVNQRCHVRGRDMVLGRSGIGGYTAVYGPGFGTKCPNHIFTFNNAMFATGIFRLPLSKYFVMARPADKGEFEGPGGVKTVIKNLAEQEAVVSAEALEWDNESPVLTLHDVYRYLCGWRRGVLQPNLKRRGLYVCAICRVFARPEFVAPSWKRERLSAVGSAKALIPREYVVSGTRAVVSGEKRKRRDEVRERLSSYWQTRVAPVMPVHLRAQHGVVNRNRNSNSNSTNSNNGNFRTNIARKLEDERRTHIFNLERQLEAAIREGNKDRERAIRASINDAWTRPWRTLGND